MRVFTLLIIAVMTAPAAAGDFEHELTVDGLKRTYRVHTPTSPDGTSPDDKPLPVVIVMHGGGGNAEHMERFDGFNAKADAAGFIVAHPNGTGRRKFLTWNAGDCCGSAARTHVDDVKFIAAMLDDLAKRYNIDKRRVYATGMSNGAMMSYRLAAELADRIAAIAPVSGTMSVHDPKPARPVPILHIHGTADSVVPYNGGHGEHTKRIGEHMAVADCIATWRKINRCDTPPTGADLPDQHNDRTTVHIDRYTPQADGAPIELWTIEGGGHRWPHKIEGSVPRWLVIVRVEPMTKEFDAPNVIWDFFKRFELPE